MRLRKKISEVLGSDRGTSMVELLVAFVVVMLALSLFTASINVAVRLYQNSLFAMDENQKFEEQYYKNRESGASEVDVTISFADKTGKQVLEIPAKMAKYQSTQEGSRGTRYWIK